MVADSFAVDVSGYNSVDIASISVNFSDNEVFGRPRDSTKKIKLSPSDIVPDEYQNRLIAWRDVFNQGQFEIGRIANELININMTKNAPAAIAAIYSAVGKFVGKSGRTIRYYAETESFYPVEIIELYSVVPFSHFAFAKSLPNWRDVLEFSASAPTTTEEELYKRFVIGVSPGTGETDCGDEIGDGGLDEYICEVSQDGPAPSGLAQTTGGFAHIPSKSAYATAVVTIDSLISALESIIGIGDALGVDNNLIDKLKSILSDLRSCVPALVATLKG